MRRRNWQAALWAVLGWSVSAQAQPVDVHRQRDLCYLESRFHAQEAAIVCEYEVAYRCLNLEISRLGTLVLRTTVGTWTPEPPGPDVPVVFMDMRFDSRDSREPGNRGRISIHDRIVAVITVPGMDALLFAKDTDEYLNPLIGRTRVLRSVSCYDVERGGLDYWHFDLPSDTVSTNLSDPQAIIDLSRKLRPILDFLMAQSHGDGKEALSPEDLKISVNASGHVVPLRLRTIRDRSPACLGKGRLTSLRVDAVPAGRTDERIYRFRSWALPFQDLAEHLKDDTLRSVSRDAFVEAVIPLGAEYELALGAIRMTLVSVRQESGNAAASPGLVNGH